MTDILNLDQVSRVYPGAQPVTALAAVNLTVAAGELVTIMGPSGSGKSTLLAIAGGLERPSEGTVSVNGEPIDELGATALATLRRRSIGFIFQQYNLVPLLTTIENVALPLELDGWSMEERTTAATNALEAVEMTDATGAFPDNLSGGQQQRVAIARAIAGSPRLILADEPTGALDSVSGESVMRIIRERVDAGAAAVVVTHDARLAAWADRILYLTDGELEEVPTGGAAR